YRKRVVRHRPPRNNGSVRPTAVVRQRTCWTSVEEVRHASRRRALRVVPGSPGRVGDAPGGGVSRGLRRGGDPVAGVPGPRCRPRPGGARARPRRGAGAHPRRAAGGRRPGRCLPRPPTVLPGPVVMPSAPPPVIQVPPGAPPVVLPK